LKAQLEEAEALIGKAVPFTPPNQFLDLVKSLKAAWFYPCVEVTNQRVREIVIKMKASLIDDAEGLRNG